MVATETELPPLTRIELDLNSVGFETRPIAAGEIENAPYAQLLVLLEELKGSALMAKLAFTEDIAIANAKLANIEPPRFKVSTLNISVALPFKKDKGKLPEMSQLATALNRYIPMGNFGASEAEGFYFRYAMVDTKADQFDTYLLVIALETALHLIKRFLPDMAALAYNKAPLTVILKKLEAKAQ